MRSKVYEVKTIDEAKSLAVKDFGVEVNDIEFNIVKETKGFLGIGSKLEVEAVLNVDGIEKGKKYIQMILDFNNIEGFIEKKVRGNNVEFNIDAGEFNGYLIGKNSRNLIALQTLVSTIINNYYEGEDLKVVLVDVGGYKRRKERSLENMAVEYGKQVARTKQTIKLDNLNAYERKIIHLALEGRGDVSTISQNEEPHRYITIIPSNMDEKYKRDFND